MPVKYASIHVFLASFHLASPPDCHNFLAGDWLSQKAMVVAAAHPALMADAA